LLQNQAKHQAQPAGLSVTYK